MSQGKAHKKQIRLRIGDLMDQYCSGCKIHADNIREHGIADTQKYCLKKCEIGMEITSLGALLEKSGNILKEEIEMKNEEKKSDKLTKEIYLDLKSKGSSDHVIFKKYGISGPTFYAAKKEWGLVKNREEAVTSVPKTTSDIDLKKEVEQWEKKYLELDADLTTTVVDLNNKIKGLEQKRVEEKEAYNDSENRFREHSNRMAKERDKYKEMADSFRQALKMVL